MNKKRITWGFVSLVVLITIAITAGSIISHSQKETPNKKDNNLLDKYASTDYNAPESTDLREREERKLKNSRYDNQYWVFKEGYPEDTGVGRYSDEPKPTLIPNDESLLIIRGKVLNFSAHLSNDKSGVYTEFKIKVEEILKDDTSKNIQQNDLIFADRAGGVVHYPNGRRIIYELSQYHLLFPDKEYLLFLKNDEESPNYAIIRGFELIETKAIPLDEEPDSDQLRSKDKVRFIQEVRSKISDSLSKQPRRQQ